MPGDDRERRFRELVRARGLRRPADRYVNRTLRELSTFFARSMFREEVARRPARLQRIDPRARVAGAVLFLVSVSLARRFPTLWAHAALPFAAAALSGIRPREFLGAGFFAAVPFAALMAFPATLNLFFDGNVALPLVDLGRARAFGPFALPAVVGFTREGLLSAATFLLRVLPSVAAVLWLTLSTRWVDLLRALRFAGVPPLVLQVAGMTVRYTHVLLRHAEEAHMGKKSRTVCRAPVAAEQGWVGSRIAASWERSLHLMDDVAAAMRARGFSGDLRFPAGSRFARRDGVFVAIVVLSCAGAHLL